MAKICNYEAKFYDEDEGLYHTEKYEIFCNANGDFFSKYKENDETFIKDLSKDFKNVDITMDGKIKSYSLSEIKEFLNKILAEKKAIIKEDRLIIEYIFADSICYGINEEQEIEPNTMKKGFSYVNGKIELSGTSRLEVFSIGISARVYKKRKLYRNGVQFDDVYIHITDEEKEIYKSIDELNSFALGGVGFMRDYQSFKKEIPYTEDAAKFFIKMIYSMCKLHNKFNTFFSDENNIFNAISAENLLMIEKQSEVENGN